MDWIIYKHGLVFDPITIYKVDNVSDVDDYYGYKWSGSLTDWYDDFIVMISWMMVSRMDIIVIVNVIFMKYDCLFSY
jgi:hypothetical protein